MTKFAENWLKNTKVTGESKNRGGKLPPVLIGLRLLISIHVAIGVHCYNTHFENPYLPLNDFLLKGVLVI